MYIVSDKMNNEEDYQNGNTFVQTFLKEDDPVTKRIILSCYFSLTMLSTVGYGDLYPIS